MWLWFLLFKKNALNTALKALQRKKSTNNTTVTSAELEFYFYCFRDDLEHAETNIMYSVNSATDNYLKIAVV